MPELTGTTLYRTTHKKIVILSKIFGLNQSETIERLIAEHQKASTILGAISENE